MPARSYSPVDQLITGLDAALTTVFGTPRGTGRPDPATALAPGEMTDAERQESARLMRVNHVGEVCAQALYQSQAVTARSNRVRQTMVQAAAEESDHLNWCEGRLRELGGRKSLLNSLWYAGAFAIGSAAGLAGDRWNLGFLEETEKRVEGHLASHLDRLPASDTRSRAVVEVMKQDEHRHACSARAAGALDLPQPVKRLMQAASRVMTTAAYWL